MIPGIEKLLLVCGLAIVVVGLILFVIFRLLGGDGTQSSGTDTE